MLPQRQRSDPAFRKAMPRVHFPPVVAWIEIFRSVNKEIHLLGVRDFEGASAFEILTVARILAAQRRERESPGAMPLWIWAASRNLLSSKAPVLRGAALI